MIHQSPIYLQISRKPQIRVFQKNDVKGKSKQLVYEWLTNKDKNGWNDLEPRWNFYKYLIDENGNLLNVFSSAVSPLDIQL